MLETQQPTAYGEETGVEDRTRTACPRWVWTPAQAQWPRALGGDAVEVRLQALSGR